MDNGLRKESRACPTGNQGGFTLLELLVVISVLGILASVVVFSLQGVSASAAVAACKSDAKIVAIAVQAYEAQNGGTAPTSLQALVSSPNHYLDSVPNSPEYTISLDQNGNVKVATPSGATPTEWTAPTACESATTAAATTAATPVSRGVSATPDPLQNSDIVNIINNNSSSVSSMVVTISIVASPGLRPSKLKLQGYSMSGRHLKRPGYFVYAFTLRRNKAISPGASGTVGVLYQLGSHSTHSVIQDTWSITSALGNGAPTTIQGTF